jgi:2'-5' RNA ligase superfamily
MGVDSNGRAAATPPEERLNIFALVIYIPGPLGKFLDDLRRELVPHYNPRAHVSVLPPRPLAVEWQTASEQVRSLALTWEPFEVELTFLDIFRPTDVIYLEVGAGVGQLRRMHEAVNTGALAFQDPFPYHPHITLAQEVPHERVPEVFELATRRWKEFHGARSFKAESAVFVQNTIHDIWLDLADFPLGSLAVR